MILLEDIQGPGLLLFHRVVSILVFVLPGNLIGIGQHRFEYLHAISLAFQHQISNGSEPDAAAKGRRRLADADPRPEVLVDTFETRGGIDRITHGGIFDG